jgi:5'-3' exonuclease
MRVHLVDGTFELYRAHFSARPPKTVRGVDVKATAGVVDSMLTLLADRTEAVTHLAVAFDNPIVSFRNDLFSGYKSDEGVPPALRAQFDLVEEAVRALGVVVWSMDHYEADDALATGAIRFSGPDTQVRILTPDKDLGQVLEGDRVVQIDRIRGTLIDEATVRLRRGVAPASIPDFLALVGDTSDGIPGIGGFGEKSAGILLGRYGSIEAIPDDPASWDVKLPRAIRLATTLAAHREDALLYKRLATLVRDVPLEESLTDLEYRGAPRGPFEALCASLEAKPRWTRFRDDVRT